MSYEGPFSREFHGSRKRLFPPFGGLFFCVGFFWLGGFFFFFFFGFLFFFGWCCVCFGFFLLCFFFFFLFFFCVFWWCWGFCCGVGSRKNPPFYGFKALMMTFFFPSPTLCLTLPPHQALTCGPSLLVNVFRSWLSESLVFTEAPPPSFSVPPFCFFFPSMFSIPPPVFLIFRSCFLFLS